MVGDIMKIVGVTGNSGSGKSYVSKVFKDKGGYVFDTDKIGHEALLSTSSVYDKIVECFGDKILDENKEINRKKLGDIVFSDKKKLKNLEKISHSFIKKIIFSTLKEIENNNNFKFVVIDGALLIESSLYKICDLLVLVEASYNTKLERIVKRDSITISQGERRLENQLDFKNVYEKFDFIINTEEASENTLNQIEQIIIQLT